MIPENIQNFRSALMRNNIVTILCLVLVLVCFILSYLQQREERLERNRYAYVVNTSGEVIPAQYALRRDNLEIEIRHHLSMFVEEWYTLNQNDYETKAEAAAWLGGNSIRDLYLQRRANGYFNRFIQNNITQHGQISELQIAPLADGTFSFSMVVDIEEKAMAYEQRWRIIASGQVAVIERSWPNNPHGLFIEPYLENKIINLSNHEES